MTRQDAPDYIPLPLATVSGVGLICPRPQCKAWTALRHAENLGKVHCMSCGHQMRAPEPLTSPVVALYNEPTRDDGRDALA